MPMPLRDLAEAHRILREHDLLGAIDPGDLDALLARAKLRRFDDGALLFQKGDPGDSLYVIQRGGIKIFALSHSGREILFNVLAEGEVFGEIALLDGKPRTADAATIGPTRLLEIRRSDVLPLVQERPELAQRMIEILCARLRWISEAYEDTVLMHFPQRLAKKLVLLAETCGDPINGGGAIDIQVSQQDLANMLGVSRQVVNKQVGEGHAAEIVISKRGHLILQDPERIGDIAARPDRNSGYGGVEGPDNVER
jgi:CRP-like cAMP-binding protein